MPGRRQPLHSRAQAEGFLQSGGRIEFRAGRPCSPAGHRNWKIAAQRVADGLQKRVAAGAKRGNAPILQRPPVQQFFHKNTKNSKLIFTVKRSTTDWQWRFCAWKGVWTFRGSPRTRTSASRTKAAAPPASPKSPPTLSSIYVRFLIFFIFFVYILNALWFAAHETPEDQTLQKYVVTAPKAVERTPQEILKQKKKASAKEVNVFRWEGKVTARVCNRVDAQSERHSIHSLCGRLTYFLCAANNNSKFFPNLCHFIKRVKKRKPWIIFLEV